jgi:hypothetical protein
MIVDLSLFWTYLFKQFKKLTFPLPKSSICIYIRYTWLANPSPYSFSSVAGWRFSQPDFGNSGGFESRLAGKKYSWRVPVSGRFLADLTKSARAYFCLVDLAEF